MAAEATGLASDELRQDQASSGIDVASEVDMHGYAFMVWTAAKQEAIRVGDDVFVSLRSDKETGKARVLQERITDPDSPYRGRNKGRAVFCFTCCGRQSHIGRQVGTDGQAGRHTGGQTLAQIAAPPPPPPPPHSRKRILSREALGAIQTDWQASRMAERCHGSLIA